MATPKNHDTSQPTSTIALVGRLFNLDLPALKQTGRVFPEQSDLFTIERVLDVACGEGEWTIAAAQAFPQLQIVGIDKRADLIESARRHARTSRVDNVRFTVMDPLHPDALPDASFDLVNLRFMVGFTPLESRPGLVKAYLRLLHTGGIIRLVEADELITTSPACERFTDLLSRALWLANHHLFPPTLFGGHNLGQNLLITPLLPRVLRNAGIRPHQAASVTDFSTGMEAHTEMAQEIARTYQRIQPWLVQVGLCTQEEIEQVYQQLLAELQAPDFGGVAFSLTVWGQKP
jgi:SAM-dependent methyltransferase